MSLWLRSSRKSVETFRKLKKPTSSPQFLGVCLSFPLFATVGLASQSQRGFAKHHYTETEPEQPRETPKSTEESSSSSSGRFDITKQWEDVKDDLLKKLIQTDEEKPSESLEKPQSQSVTEESSTSVFGKLSQVMSNALDDCQSSKKSDEASSSGGGLEDMGKTFMKLIVASGNAANNNSIVEDIVSKARNMDEQGDISDKVSLTELLEVIQKAAMELDETMSSFMGDDKVPVLHPTNLYYYLEHQDEVKNPSAKRRQHRFCSGVDVAQVDELNEQLRLALLSYTDSMEDIQESLERDFDCELAYCTMDSYPNRPSHFVAVKRNQSQWSNDLLGEAFFSVF